MDVLQTHRDMIAYYAYPGMASLATFWIFIALARYAKYHRGLALLLASFMGIVALAFVEMSLSTGGRNLLPYTDTVTVFRALWLLNAGIGWIYTLLYVRRWYRGRR